MRRAIVASVLLLACGKADSPQTSNAASPALPAAAPVRGACPSDGAWAECSVIYRLERAGVAPKIDSTGKPAEALLGGRPLMVKVGMSAELEVHLYADSASRIAAAAKLDRKEFVNGTATQSIKRERTLIESANLIAMLTSINPRQRERVFDALMAGPPQPEQPQQPQVLKPVKSGK